MNTSNDNQTSKSEATERAAARDEQRQHDQDDGRGIEQTAQKQQDEVDDGASHTGLVGSPR